MPLQLRIDGGKWGRVPDSHVGPQSELRERAVEIALRHVEQLQPVRGPLALPALAELAQQLRELRVCADERFLRLLHFGRRVCEPPLPVAFIISAHQMEDLSEWIYGVGAQSGDPDGR